MDTINPVRGGSVLIRCTSDELADLRWLVGIAMMEFEESAEEVYLAIALEIYKALHVAGSTPTPQLYLKRTL